MISLFSINVLKKQRLLIHGTSPRFYVINGERKPFFCSEKGGARLFLKHEKIFLNSLEIDRENFLRVTQVHGNYVYVLKDPDILVSEVGKFEADAIITHIPNCPIAVLTADCVPIIIYDPIKHVTGLVHAGRMGTQKNILTNTIEALSREYGSSPKDLIMGMGPAIRGCCYEVNESSALPFIKKYSLCSEFIKKTEKNKFSLDLPMINQFEGCKAGVLKENIHSDVPCTVCENHRWYSYRKEGKTGRLVTLAMLQRRE
jgi:YfiH family protein